MAIPSFGGMMMVLVTVLLVPVLYATVKELRLKARKTVEARLDGEPDPVHAQQG